MRKAFMQGGRRGTAKDAVDRMGERPWHALRHDVLAGVSVPVVGVTLLLCLFSTLCEWLKDIAHEKVSFAQWMQFVATDFVATALSAIPILLLVVRALNRHPSAGRRQWLAIAVAVTTGSAAAVAIKLPIELLLFDFDFVFGNVHFLTLNFVQFYVRCVILAALYALVVALERQALQRIVALHQADVDRVRLDQQLDEARLQVLQAQIEPHFLFNTLANVRRLYATEPAVGGAMLDNLMRYLSAALPQMRSEASTLEREATLAEAYLGVQKIRMGERLRFDIDVPDTLRGASLPPMMLLTLVENAIKHGIGPLPQGGVIRILAREVRGRLEVGVADSGRGFTQSSGSGTGLANLRARLSALYGPAGRLIVATNVPVGASVTIALPLDGSRACP